MKVLLIGSSFSAAPFLFELKRLGAEVTVIGKYESDPGHGYADHSIFEDYSDPEILGRICQQHGFDHVVPSCNDYSYVAGAAVANRLGYAGFDNPEVTAILHTKDRFRQFCHRIGVPSPRIHGEVAMAEDGAVSPLPIFDGAALVKPVDSFSGRGVEQVRTQAELPGAIARAMDMSRGKRAVVEQFVEGALHSHTAFIADGQVVWHDFVDEFCEVYAYQVDRSTYPSRLTDELRARVHESIGAIVSALGLCDGLLHTQFIASSTDFWIIECMRRCPGDLYGRHFRFSFGYDYEAQYVAGFVGNKPQAPATPLPDRAAIERRVLSVDRNRSFFGVELAGDGRRMAYVPLKDSGQLLKAAPFDKAGILFLINDDATGVAMDGNATSRLLFHG